LKNLLKTEFFIASSKWWRERLPCLIAAIRGNTGGPLSSPVRICASWPHSLRKVSGGVADQSTLRSKQHHQGMFFTSLRNVDVNLPYEDSSRQTSLKLMCTASPTCEYDLAGRL
jgi:hypothetical protein